MDFSKAPDFLDKELFQEVVDEKKGRRHADRLAKVLLKNGKEKWILVHVEVQSTKEAEFSERMFQYFYRIFDRHEEKIVAVAVHTSTGNITEMMQFEYDYFGTKLTYSYNNYRIEDYSDDELELSKNIFSKAVLAARAMNRTKNEVEQRYRFKRKLMQELIRNKEYSRTAVVAVLYFIDYLLKLPEAYTKRMSEEIGPEIRKERGLMELYNEENTSPTILYSFAEQLDRGIAKGMEKGLEKGILQGIEKGIEQGLEQGASLEKKNIAKRLLAEKMPIEMIATVTGLNVEEVHAIQEQDL